MNRTTHKRVVLVMMVVVGLAAFGGATPVYDKYSFHVEYTLYANNTIILAADTVHDYPFGQQVSVPEREYTFNVQTGDGAVLHNETVEVHFPGHSILPPDHPDRGEPMTSNYIRVPVFMSAKELAVVHEGEEIRSLDLVDAVCSEEPTGACDLFCHEHGVDPDCEFDESDIEFVSDTPDDDREVPDLGSLLPMVLLMLMLGIVGVLVYNALSERRTPSQAARGRRTQNQHARSERQEYQKQR